MQSSRVLCLAKTTFMYSDIITSDLGEVSFSITFNFYYYYEVASVVSNSVRPHRHQPTRHLRPWDSPSRNTVLLITHKTNWLEFNLLCLPILACRLKL